MKPLISLLLGGVAVLMPARGHAQEERFEISRRLRALEAVWQQQTDARARARALKPLQQATNIFLFEFYKGDVRLREATRFLDQARFALAADKEIDSDRRWAESLHVTPISRLFDTSADELSLTLTPFYPVEAKVPATARLRLALVDAQGKPLSAVQETAIVRLPVSVTFSVKGISKGDHQLRTEIVVGDQVLARGEQALSWVTDLSKRLAALRQTVMSRPEAPNDTQRQTVRASLDILERLARRQLSETAYPAAHLLAEAEAAAAAGARGKPFYGQKKPGVFWLTLAVEKQGVPSRLMAPPAAARGTPLPLVILIHGTGGSENLCFDVHGPGLVVDLCRERGWLLVAPRSSLFGPPSLSGVLAEVEKLYPVDRRRLFLVGASIGGMHAVELAQEQPGQVAGVAALAGAGGLRYTAALKKVAFFVAAGDGDHLMLEPTRRLRAKLEEVGVEELQYREYAGVEHITVDVSALPDIFRFFDRVAQR